MIIIGDYNTLKVIKEVDFGVYLDGEEQGEILLPKRYVPENLKVDDELEVFIYFDSEDRIIATTEKPLVLAREFACLDVVSVTGVGAFLNWGLPKDLLLPFREQTSKLREGDKAIVYVYLDIESQRLVASAKTDKYLDKIPAEYTINEEVNVLIGYETELGYKAIINNKHSGIIYKNEIFQPVETGQRLKAYIKKLREDGKIDLSLQQSGLDQTEMVATQILDYLKTNNGTMNITDKSSPEIISNAFGISKKNFKKAVGNLYKKKLIILENDSIRLTE